MPDRSNQQDGPLSKGVRAAVDHLRQAHARPGSNEGGYLLDEDTGAVLEYAVGTADAVEFDEEKLNASVRVCVLHSHPADSPANQYDWQWFIERHNAREMIVVGPIYSYFVQKPAGWQAPNRWRQSPFEDWEDHAVNVAIERGFFLDSPPDAVQRHDLEVEVNRRMAAQFGLKFRWETTDETD